MQRVNMSDTELAHKHRQGSPHRATWMARGGFTQHQLKVNMATMGAAILPLIHNKTQHNTNPHKSQKLKTDTKKLNKSTAQ